MLTDIQIAQNAKMEKIVDIAKKLDIHEDGLELYGDYKAKVKPAVYESLQDGPDGKLVLVTAINPTPAGEGKTTTTVGLGRRMHRRLAKRPVIALREPSLGPVFGIKGGAAGGGYAQVRARWRTSTCTLRATCTPSPRPTTCSRAMLDNHHASGQRAWASTAAIILVKRCRGHERPRAARDRRRPGRQDRTACRARTASMITVASEVMAILCLADGHRRPQASAWATSSSAYTYGRQARSTASDLKARRARWRPC